jgi:nucleotide-binding universal stress UspA family protein
MFETILVPLDGSLFGEQALGPARMIAEHTGASVELVRVHVPHPSRELAGPAVEDELRREARLYLAHAALELEHVLHDAVPTTVLEGPVAESLCEHAARHASALMVMATHGRTGVSRAWLGSVADSVIRGSPIPVLLVRVREKGFVLVRPREPSPYQRILVPLDGSRFSEEILKHAMELGRVSGAHIHLLTVVEPIVIPEYGFPMPVATPLETAEIRERAQHYIEDLVARLGPLYLPNKITGEMRDGEPAARAILDRAKYMSADLIAFATHARGVSRFFVGSVADKVLRGTTSDVLTIRPMRD